MLGTYQTEVLRSDCSDHATLAQVTLEEIGKLYDIEEEIRGKPPETRLKIRQDQAKPLVTKLFASFTDHYKKLPKKSLTGQAIAYALNNKEALQRFLTDGKIEIDNNASERALRSIAIGRKNWLFAGSDRGGETAAGIYSLIETAKINRINPWRYLQKVLATDLSHLLRSPAIWGKLA